MSSRLIQEGLTVLKEVFNRPYTKRAVRGLAEREQMHMRAPSAVSRKGLSVDDLENKLKSPNPVSNRILEPMNDLMNKYPEASGAQDVPSNELYSSKEKVRQNMYDEITGQQGIFRDEFESRRSHIDSQGPGQTQFGPREDPLTVGKERSYTVQRPYQKQLDSLRKTLGVRPSPGLTSRTRRGPR